MAFFTEQQLYQFADSASLENRAAPFLNESVETARISIFLSHSHRDRKKVRGIIKHLAGLGIDIYVDANDSSMPRETGRLTAEKIKQRIAELSIFMVLLTRNACKSKWVPWEIGVADKTKGESNVLLIPVADESGLFFGMEFLRLYRRVAIATTGQTCVFRPGKAAGLLLETYLERYGL